MLPPTITSNEAEWLTYKLISSLGCDVNTDSTENMENSVTFTEYFKHLESNHLSGLPKDQVNSSIDEVHQWLVKEICMSGYLYKRTRKQGNWTNWLKRWFILTPGKLTYYDSAKMKERKGEIPVCIQSKVESLQDQRMSFWRSMSLFKVTNAPFLEIEMAATDEKDRRAWLTALQDIREAAKAGTTPVKALLEDRYQNAQLRKNALSEVEERIKSIKVKGTSANPIHVRLKAANVPSPNPRPKQARKQKPPLPPKPKHHLALMKLNGSQQSENNATNKENIGQNTSHNFATYQQEKMKAVFANIDSDGNGFISKAEFLMFIQDLGVAMCDKEANAIFTKVDKNCDEKISFLEFSEYFIDSVIDDNGRNGSEGKLRSAFLKADQDGTGTVDFKDFVEFAWERKRSVRVSKLLKEFKHLDQKNKGEVEYNDFNKFITQQRKSFLESIEEEGENTEAKTMLEDRLKRMYETADPDQLVTYLRDRWQKFVSFKRYGASGDLAMTGKSGFVADIVPGEYTLLDLGCFSDLPPIQPKHVIVKGVKWDKSSQEGRSGRLSFPDDFDFKIPMDIATTEHLRYYGCCLADHNQVQVC